MNQKIKKIYCDTSVFGGVFDREFERASKRFLDLVKNKSFQIVVSPVIDAEISDSLTPPKV